MRTQFCLCPLCVTKRNCRGIDYRHDCRHRRLTKHNPYTGFYLAISRSTLSYTPTIAFKLLLTQSLPHSHTHTQITRTDLHTNGHTRTRSRFSILRAPEDRLSFDALRTHHPNGAGIVFLRLASISLAALYPLHRNRASIRQSQFHFLCRRS